MPLPDFATLKPIPTVPFDLSDLQDRASMKKDVADKMTDARVQAGFEKATGVLADIGERAAYTASLLNPLEAVGRAAQAIGLRTIPQGSGRQVAEFFDPLGAAPEGSARQGAQQALGDLIEAGVKPESVAGILSGEAAPALFLPGMTGTIAPSINELKDARTPAEAARAGITLGLSLGGTLLAGRLPTAPAGQAGTAHPVESITHGGAPLSAEAVAEAMRREPASRLPPAPAGQAGPAGAGREAGQFREQAVPVTKGQQNAVQERSTAQVNVGQAPQNSGGVGSREVVGHGQEGGPGQEQGSSLPQAPETALTAAEQEAAKEDLADWRPAIRLVPKKAREEPEIVVGKQGDTHPEIIKRHKLTPEQIDSRGFIDQFGNWRTRTQAAAETGIKTEFQPGELHSTELARVQSEPTHPPPTAQAGQAGPPTAQAGQAGLPAAQAGQAGPPTAQAGQAGTVAAEEATGSMGGGAATPAEFPSLPSKTTQAVEAAAKPLMRLRNTAAKLFQTKAIKATMARARDAGDTLANTFARTQANVIRNSIRRIFKPSEKRVADNALSLVVEAKGDPNALGDMRSKVIESPNASPKWRKIFTDAADFAIYHWDKLFPIAGRYNEMHDAEVESENRSGMPTLRRPGYVMHAQEMPDEQSDYLSAPQGTSTGFLKNRTHDTFADSIAAGIDPKTLSSADLMESRIRRGQRAINSRNWVSSLKTLEDNGRPIATDITLEKRADGSAYQTAPHGYVIERASTVPVAVSRVTRAHSRR